jgi:Rrf2 family protein
VLAGVELAGSRPGDRAVPVRELAARTGVPEGFLVQVLQSLRRAGIVESVRGAAGGFRLAGPAAEISVGRVLRAAGGSERYLEPSGFAEEALSRAGGAAAAAERSLGFVLDEAERSLARTFESLSLATVLEHAAGPGPAPEYQI